MCDKTRFQFYTKYFFKFIYTKIMTNISGEIKNLELNCTKKLCGFVSKLNQNADILKKHSVKLKQIAADLQTKSQQIQKLENIKPENVRHFSIDQRDAVLSEILYRVNDQAITANRLINELADLYNELKIDFQNLTASANALQISSAECSVINGDCKQKPISFYIEEACQILYAWMLYQQTLALSLNEINIRNDDSIKLFANTTISNADLSANLDRYILFSTFLLTQK